MPPVPEVPQPSLWAEWSKTTALGLQALFIWWMLRNNTKKVGEKTQDVVKDTAAEQTKIIKAQSLVITTQNSLLEKLRKEVEKNTSTSVIISDKFAETNSKVHQTLERVETKLDQDVADKTYGGPRVELDPEKKQENPGSVTVEETPKQSFGKVIRKD